MKSISIQGGFPLNGEIIPSGSTKSAAKLILLSLFSTEEVVFSHVPRVGFIEDTLDLVRSLGADVEWKGDNKLLINSSGVSTPRVPFEKGVKHEYSVLLVPPLVFRFGKAIIPRPENISESALEKCISTWKSLGFEVKENQEWLMVEIGNPVSTGINFKSIDPLRTINAIASSIFIKEKTVITSAAEEPEVDELIDFFSLLGASIDRVEPRRIEVEGESLFKGASFKVSPSVNEIVYFAVAALVTGGTITIKSVNKVALAPFINILNKVGTNFEFLDNNLTVWHGGEEFNPVEVEVKPAPGFISDWLPPLALLLTKASGESVLKADFVSEEWDFVSDFNRLGTDISFQESDNEVEGRQTVEEVSSKSGILISGPVDLKGATLDLTNRFSGPALVLAALTSVGKSQVRGVEAVEYFYEDFLEKLIRLGARISI